MVEYPVVPPGVPRGGLAALCVEGVARTGISFQSLRRRKDIPRQELPMVNFVSPTMATLVWGGGGAPPLLLRCTAILLLPWGNPPGAQAQAPGVTDTAPAGPECAENAAEDLSGLTLCPRMH